MCSKGHKKRGFTLIEMVIVLIIMWILLMVTIALSGDQIQKIKNKAIKESILAEWQSHYSRNLWSSSFAWNIYDTMQVNIEKGSNQIDFVYIQKDENENHKQKNVKFTDKFEIKYITKNYYSNVSDPELIMGTGISLQYKPYQMYCHIWWENENSADNLVLIMTVDNNRDYCFEIQRQNCRLLEMSESSCDSLKDKLHINWNI